LDKEKKFPPLPEWPPPSLNTNNNATSANNLGLGLNGNGNGIGSKEPNTITSVPPNVHLTLSSNSPMTGSTFAGSILSHTDSPRASPAPVPARSTADTVPPPVTAGFGGRSTSPTSPIETKAHERGFTRKRASTATNATTTTNSTNVTVTQEPSKKITLTKDNVTGFGRNTPTPPGNANANTNANTNSNSNAPGAFALDDRRKVLSQSENGHTTKTTTQKAMEGQTRGSTSSNNAMGTVKTYTAGTKNLSSSTRALTSPTPGNFNLNQSTIIHQPDRSHPQPNGHVHGPGPRQPYTSVGRYNTMGLPMADNVSLLRAGTPMSTRSTRTGVLTTASWSEAAEEDLVSNLGSRERTRQEVLWEIVASEQRCVRSFFNSLPKTRRPTSLPLPLPPSLLFFYFFPTAY
jgi:hypothetical protein